MYSTPVVLVEGRDDINLVKSLFNNADPDPKHIIVISPEIRGLNRKGIVIRALHDINYNSYEKGKRYIGIVDSDFNDITGTKKKLTNLFYTDCHDFDTQIFISKAFEKYLQFDYIDPENLNFIDIRNACFNMASEIGYYLLSLYDLKLHEIMKVFRQIEKFIDYPLTLVFSKIHNVITNSLKKLGKNHRDLLAKIEFLIKKRKNEKVNPHHLASGHLVIRVFSLLILWEMYKLKKKGLSRQEKTLILNDEKKMNSFARGIENDLRKSYEIAHFAISILYTSIKLYEKKNQIFFIKEK